MQGLPSHRFILVRFLLCFYSGTSVSAEIDEAVLEDGTKIQPVSVLFPEGSSVPAPPQSEVLAQHPRQTSQQCPLMANIGATHQTVTVISSWKACP